MPTRCVHCNTHHEPYRACDPAMVERERCAKIAEEYTADAPPMWHGNGRLSIPRGAEGWEAEEIAARIRSGE